MLEQKRTLVLLVYLVEYSAATDRERICARAKVYEQLDIAVFQL